MLSAHTIRRHRGRENEHYMKHRRGMTETHRRRYRGYRRKDSHVKERKIPKPGRIYAVTEDLMTERQQNGT